LPQAFLGRLRSTAKPLKLDFGFKFPGWFDVAK